MTLAYCRAPAAPVPTYSATDLIDRLNFLRLNLWRYDIVSVAGGAAAVDPMTTFGEQKRGWTMPGGSATPRVQVLGKVAALSSSGAAYDLSFEAATDTGTATLRARWLDSSSGAITGISDQSWTITTTPTTFTWEGIASDDADFAAAVPSNSYFEFFVSSTSDIPSGATVTITELQIQNDNFWDQQGIALPWRPAKGEPNLLTYGEYILGLNTDEMSANPNAQVVVGPEGGGLQLVPNGPVKLITDDTTARTLSQADDGCEITFTNALGCTVTLPANADATIITKSLTRLRRATGAGPVVVVAGSGATLVGPPGCTFTITSEEGEATVEKKTTNGWEWAELGGNPINIGGVTVESGAGEPTRMDRAEGSLWARTDKSQLWRFRFGRPAGVNIVGTDLKSAGGTNIVTLTGFNPAVAVRFSKPLAADSDGLLTWDAFSPWPDDSGTTPTASPVAGQTWNDFVSIYGNNGGSDVLLFTASLNANYYATAAAAFAALAAQLPVILIGYATYKVSGIADPNPSDNRGGLSILAEIGEWVRMGDLTTVKSGGSDVETDARSLDFVSGAIAVTKDNDGNVVVTLGTDTDVTLAANSDAKIATQKATRAYIDAAVAAAVNGLSWKQEVRAATTANGTLSTAFANGQTLDGVTLATGDRILVKNQTTASQNGIYIVAASGAPTRAADADAGTELVNASVYVSEGTTQADTQWTCSTNAPITLGTTSLTFAQIGVGGSSLTVSDEGASLTSTATSIDFVGAGVVATNTGGAVTVTIPGGAGGQHEYEAFGALPASGFTAAHQVTSSLTYGTAALVVKFGGAGGTNSLETYTEAAPGSTPWDVYARIQAAIPSSPAGSQAGICLKNSSSGKIVAYGANSNSSYTVQRWTNETTFSVSAITSAGTTQWLWLRVNNNGTTLTFYQSYNGLDWVSIGTETLSTFISSVDRIGFYVDPGGTSATQILFIGSFGTAAPT